MEKRPRSKKRIIRTTVIVICALLVAAILFGANYLVDFAVKSDFETPNIMPEISISDEAIDHILDTWDEQDADMRDRIEEVGSQTVTIFSDEGMRLCSELIPAESESHKWAIAVHGYRGVHSDVYPLALYYSEENYNVLMPDLRGCGDSEGDYVGMGWLDRKDMLRWIDLILQKDPEAEIVLHGISMGGATVCMTSGEDLPANVKAIVSDCAYTSVWDIFSDELKLLFHLPDFPILHLASAFCSLRAGYGFREASSLEQVKKATVPMLFIHGSEDNFVSTDMVYVLYDACAAEKELLVVDGAWHGTSCNHNPELYFETLFSFLDSCIS